MKPYPVEVLWFDSMSQPGWVYSKDAETLLFDKQRVLRSVGLLIHKDRGKIVLVGSYDPIDESFNQHNEIPMGAIKRIRRLR